MTALQAVIFDLSGTLIDWPDWDDDIERRCAIITNLAELLPLLQMEGGRPDYG